jgi:hypothetical protein
MLDIIKTKKEIIVQNIHGKEGNAVFNSLPEKEQTRQILTEMQQQRGQEPVLPPFSEKILASMLDVYDAYADAVVQRKQIGEVIIRPEHTIASISPILATTSGQQQEWHKNALNTLYPLNTPDELILKLESVRNCNFRIRLAEGFTSKALKDLVGQASSDRHPGMLEGYYSRDKDNRPQLLPTSRSPNGILIEPENIVYLEFANRNQGGMMWQHPSYKSDDGHFVCLDRNDFLIRSRMTSNNAQTGHYFDAKLYDQGKFIFELKDFSPSHEYSLNRKNEHLLPPEVLPELLTYFSLTNKESDDDNECFAGYSNEQIAWLRSERARELEQTVQETSDSLKNENQTMPSRPRI